MKEKDEECIKDIMKIILKSYKKSFTCNENIIGYDDLPIYVQYDNMFKYDGRTERIYYTK